MKIKGLTKKMNIRKVAFLGIFLSLLPILQIRFNTVAGFRHLLIWLTFLFTGTFVANAFYVSSGHGNVMPVKYIESSRWAGCMDWTGCRNSFLRKENININDFVIITKGGEVNE